MINNFEIKKLKTMEGSDGYVTSCELHYNGVHVGNFFDNGDGSMYTFSPRQNEVKINNLLKQFPLIKGYGGYCDVEWDIGILVEELINQNEAKKMMKRYEKTHGAIVLVEAVCQEVPTSFYLGVNGYHSDEDIISAAEHTCACKSYECIGTTIYRNVDDLDVDYGLTF